MKEQTIKNLIRLAEDMESRPKQSPKELHRDEWIAWGIRLAMLECGIARERPGEYWSGDRIYILDRRTNEIKRIPNPIGENHIMTI